MNQNLNVKTYHPSDFLGPVTTGRHCNSVDDSEIEHGSTFTMCGWAENKHIVKQVRTSSIMIEDLRSQSL